MCVCVCRQRETFVNEKSTIRSVENFRRRKENEKRKKKTEKTRRPPACARSEKVKVKLIRARRAASLASPGNPCYHGGCGNARSLRKSSRSAIDGSRCAADRGIGSYTFNKEIPAGKYLHRETISTLPSAATAVATMMTTTTAAAVAAAVTVAASALPPTHQCARIAPPAGGRRKGWLDARAPHVS